MIVHSTFAQLYHYRIYYAGPVNSVVFGDFAGSEKIGVDNTVRTNALFFLIVVSNRALVLLGI